MSKCYGFKSDPSNITVSIDTTERMGDSLGVRVMIEDPSADNTYAMAPQSARLRADMMVEATNSPGCIRLANEMREKADRADKLNNK